MAERADAVAEATAALRAADPILGGLIDALPAPLARLERLALLPPEELYATLVRTIVGQQLSTRAAAAIWKRLLAHFDGRPPTPLEVLEADAEQLRAAAGLSRAKVSYLRSLAEHVERGELELDRLSELTDEEAISELVAVKGIGEWSAHMFLMFALGREDVLAPGDLGIRRAVMLGWGLERMPAPREVIELAEPWRPWRTIACLYLWASIDGVPG